MTNNQNGLYQDMLMFEGENFTIRRENQSIVAVINDVNYRFEMVFRSQFAYVPTDIVVTIHDDKISLYGNGFLIGEHNIGGVSFETKSLHILPPKKEYIKENIDLVSDILFYDQGFNSGEVKLFIDRHHYI